MTATAALAIAIQIIGLFPTVEPAVIQAVKDFRNLFQGGGKEPTQAEIDALLDKIKAQSAEIQKL